ncbi:hypothetical protein ACFYUK_13395 [Nonomuraea wenchangensis]
MNPMDISGAFDSSDPTAWVTSTPWPVPNDSLTAMGQEDEQWLIACMDWPRDKWLGYVMGYRQAAEVLLTYVDATRRHQDTLVYPFLLCWRHYVELQLKVLITLQQKWYKLPVEVPRTHKIDALWSVTKRLLFRGELDSEDAEKVQHVEAVLHQLNVLDPTSEHFRYPVKKDGTDTLTALPRVHLRRFQNAMERIANLLEALDTKLRVDIERRAEMDAEWSTIYPE